MPCATGCCILIEEITIGLYWNIHGHSSNGFNDAAALAGLDEACVVMLTVASGNVEQSKKEKKSKI